MANKVNTVVIGAGQAGLSVSYYLSEQGCDHIVLEKNQVGEAWRSGRWDSFTLVSPNWAIRLPGYGYQGPDSDSYLAREEVVRYLEAYARHFNPPLQTRVEVRSVEDGQGNGFRVETSAGRVEAANVVIATGAFQKPRIPQYAKDISSRITQIHTSQYRNPQALPPGAVLVVGSAQSGCQIAEELYQHGRKVYLSTGSAGRLPRRYRGKDIFWWVETLGLFDQTVDDLESPKDRFEANPQLTGKDGGHALNLHQFHLDGVTLLGRLRGASESKIYLAGDLYENLEKMDGREKKFIEGVEKFLLKSGMAPNGEPDLEPALDAAYSVRIIPELDLGAAGIGTILWATGYTFDFSWVRFPIFDPIGYPVQKRGATARPGLYFIGLQYLHKAKSSLLMGVGEDAAHIAALINKHNKG